MSLFAPSAHAIGCAILVLSLATGCVGTDNDADDGDLDADAETDVFDGSSDQGADTDWSYSPCEEHGDCGSDGCCNAGLVCEPRSGFAYLAVRSRTVADEELHHSMPGPDIDAIQIYVDGEPHYPTRVVAVAQGGRGPLAEPEANAFDDPHAVLGPNDAIPDQGGVCELDPEARRFWSMGGEGGYVVVEFDIQIPYQATIAIWALDDIVCDNIGITWADAFEVLVGDARVDPEGSLDASGWHLLASAPGASGGLEVFYARRRWERTGTCR